MASRVKTHKPTGLLYIRNLPPQLKNSFKAKCAQYGYFIEDVVECLLRAYLEKPERFNVVRKEKRRDPWRGISVDFTR